MSSPALYDEPERDVALWEDDGGTLVGFGFIQNRGWLDLAVHPAARSHGIEDQIVEWAVERFQQVARGRTQRFPY